jgi:hypothetical protein
VQLRSWFSWRLLAIALVAGGLGAAGGHYAATHAALGPASQPPPPAQLTADPSSQSPAIAKPKQVAQAGSALPIARPGAGLVTALTTDPPSITLLQQGGQEMTYRVTNATVFVAGQDRPYHLHLVQVGDRVRVQGGIPGVKQAAATGPTVDNPSAAAPKARKLGAAKSAAKQAAEGDPTLPIARRVVVRPAAELRANQQPAGQNGKPQRDLPPTSQDSAVEAVPVEKGTGHAATQ